MLRNKVTVMMILLLAVGMMGCKEVGTIERETKETETVFETETENTESVCEVVSNGYTISVDFPEEYTCQVCNCYFVCSSKTTEDSFEIISNQIPDFVDYDEAMGNEELGEWHLSLTDGKLVRTWTKNNVDCSMYYYEKRIPLGETENEPSAEDEYGYFVLFSHPSTKYVYDIFFPTSLSETEVEELLAGINVSFET